MPGTDRQDVLELRESIFVPGRGPRERRPRRGRVFVRNERLHPQPRAGWCERCARWRRGRALQAQATDAFRDCALVVTAPSKFALQGDSFRRIGWRARVRRRGLGGHDDARTLRRRPFRL